MRLFNILLLVNVILITSCAPQIDVFNKKIDQQNISILNLEYSLSEMESKLNEVNNNLKYITKFNDSLQLILNNKHSIYQFNWISLNRGENKHFFKLSEEGELYYSNSFFEEKYKGDISMDKFETIELSKAHNNKYLCYTTNTNTITKSYYINWNNLNSYLINIKSPLNWFSWSPNDEYIILGSYYEADMTLYIYDLFDKKLTPITCFDRDIKVYAGERSEQVDFDLQSLIWITPKVFKIIVDLKCNPYTSDNCYEKDERSNIKRKYLYYYDIGSKKIINSKQLK